jgi:endoglucanase
MKFLKLFLIVILLVLMSSFSFGATLSLKAIWTPNTEPDMAGYNLYRTDTAARTKINSTLLPFHPGPGLSSYAFALTVADNSSGTLSFVLTAVDISGNESADSNIATYVYTSDTIPPGVPQNLKIIKP